LPMDTCSKCGSPRSPNDQFCHFCGAALTAPPTAAPTTPSPAPTPAATPAVKRPDLVGIVSFGFLLVILGIVFGLNPNAGLEFYQWIESSAKAAYATRPPDTLLASTELFFALATLSGLVTAGLRYANDRTNLLRPIADALGALGTLSFTVLVGLYAQLRVSGPSALAIQAAVVGVLIVTYVAWAVTLSRRARHVREVAAATTDRRET